MRETFRFLTAVAGRPQPLFRIALLGATVGLAVAAGAGSALGQTFTRLLDIGPVVTDSVSLFGGSWGDWNGDGLVDIYTAGAGNQFYRNDADSFVAINGGDVVTRRGPNHWYINGLWGDYDNDGDLDLYRGAIGDLNPSDLSFLTPGPDFLYSNSGPPSYALIPSSIDSDSAATVSVSWVDYDRDGDIDLSTSSSNMTPDAFYRNDGGGAFQKVTTLPFLATTGPGAVTTWIDYDGDGDEDCYTVNQGTPNELWVSQLSETSDPDSFIANTTSALVQDATEFDITSEWADYDNDGDPDVFVAVSGPFGGGGSDHLYRNDGGGNFTSILTEPMVTPGNTSFGAWGDYDNDGDLDLFVAQVDVGKKKPRFFRNDGGTFVEIVDGTGDLLTRLPAPQAGQWADADNDGDLDLYIITYNFLNAPAGDPQPNYFYRNEGGNGNHWLLVRCEGTVSNRSAMGAKLRVHATIGGQPGWQSRIISGSMSGNTEQADLRAHFGLGDATKADTLRIEWPSGVVQILTDVAADQILAVQEPSGTGIPGAFGGPGIELASWPNPFVSEATIGFVLPRTGDVELSVFDASGRRIRTLLQERLGAGRHTVRWDARDEAGSVVAAGIYGYQVRTVDFVETRKIVFVR